jgi:hypothetical protein
LASAEESELFVAGVTMLQDSNMSQRPQGAARRAGARTAPVSSYVHDQNKKQSLTKDHAKLSRYPKGKQRGSPLFSQTAAQGIQARLNATCHKALKAEVRERQADCLFYTQGGCALRRKNGEAVPAKWAPPQV